MAKGESNAWIGEGRMGKEGETRERESREGEGRAQEGR